MLSNSPPKPLSRLSYFNDGMNLMDEGGVQFYLDHVVVVHDSGAMLGGRRVCGNEWRGRKEGCVGKKGGGEEEGRRGGRREEGRSGYDYSPSTPT